MIDSKSLGDVLRSSCSAFADRPAMHRPSGSKFDTISYRDLFEIVRKYAGGLRSLGLKRGDKVAILSENCIEWVWTDWACQCLGVPLIPIYATLPADQAEYIVRDCGARFVVVGSSEQAEKIAPVEGVSVVALKDGDGSLAELAKQDLMTSAEFDASIDATSPDDVATIIYTSGTTGLPKGAILKHSAFTFLCLSVRESIPISESDTFLSFLPMSHIYERFAGTFLPISLGASIAYSKGLASLGTEMTVVKPTIMLCVPRFLEATRDRILDSIRKAPPFRQKLFRLALSQGSRRAAGEFAPLAGLLDKLVGTKIRERTGGRIRFLVSGGAALPPALGAFYSAFRLQVLQGYGLTETAAATCLNHPDRDKPHTVGEPIPGMEVRIATDGEILVRGPGVMVGYLNLPEETAAAIDPEGWFHTGDIGEFEGKNLKITDRKKDLIVLSNGKNVAPQPIENKLRSSAMISEAIVIGDAMDACGALVVPNFDAVRAALNFGNEVKLSESSEAKALMKKEIDKVNKTLAPFELVKKFQLLDAPLTIESGELTPTLKVKKKFVIEKYRHLVDAMR